MSLAGERVAALLPAAGQGRRLGGPLAKPFVPLGGRAILVRTLEVFEACAAVDDIWLIVAAEQCDYCRQTVVQPYDWQKVRGVVPGGATRQESVWCGLQQVPETVGLVVVHDAVRPFVTAALVEETLRVAAESGAAVAAVPLHDTLKRVAPGGEVEATLPRDRLWRAQTPQAFRHPLLREAFQHAWQQGLHATDEAGLVEALGHPVRVVRGSEWNVKITTPDDLRLGEALVRHLV